MHCSNAYAPCIVVPEIMPHPVFCLTLHDSLFSVEKSDAILTHPVQIPVPGGTCHIRFKSAEIADKVFQQRNKLCPQFRVYRDFISHKIRRNLEAADEAERNRKARKASNDAVLTRLESVARSGSSFDDQVDALVQVIELNEVEVGQREAMLNHLERSFALNCPRVRVQAFGSSVNGLGFKGCDLDVYVDLDLIGRNPKGHEGQKAKVRFIGRLLRNDFRDYVYKVVEIPQARVPIVTFTHTMTQISCDLSFKNEMSVLNTRFIGLSLQWAPFMRPLIMALRYWAKLNGVSGSGLSGRISSYGFTFLVIFYLMKDKLFPKVKDFGLQEPEIEGWLCGFDPDGD